ncbi:MAG: hypothetical protein COT84_00200 [Chlamydiae bacterium CG10_big_fil_rev_8_21_14_0_10_35_9]|nr:MAG: hypothetical protein COT84_00200 [Chlamydiae bacterium CG10_big_fil_rev_8_21_14_0_10_35_9]
MSQVTFSNVLSNENYFYNDVQTSTFKFLNLQSLLQYGASSKNHLRITAQYIKPREIQNFIDELLLRLSPEKYASQIEKLNINKEKICNVENQLNLLSEEKYPNLPFVRLNIIEVKKSLLEVLKAINNKDASIVEDFKQIPPPRFFENFFLIFAIHQRLEKLVDQIPFFQKQIVDNKIDFLLETIELFSDELQKNRAYESVAITLLTLEELDRALEITRLITNAEKRCNVLLKVFNSFLKSENIDKAQEVLAQALESAHFIPCAWRRCRALFQVSQSFLQLNNRKEARAILHRIFHLAKIALEEQKKNRLFSDLSEAFLEVNDPVTALEVAKLIPEKFIRNDAFKVIFDFFLEVKDMRAALKMAELLSKEKSILMACNAFISLSETFLELKDLKNTDYTVQRALKFIEKSPIEVYTKSSMLKKVAKIFLRSKSLKSSLKIIEQIPNQTMKEEAHMMIIEILTKNGKKDKAFEVAELLPGGLRNFIHERIKSNFS